MGGRITFFEYKEGSGGIGGIDSFTKLMLHMDEDPFVDSSASAHGVSEAGDVVRSAAQSKFGGYSAYYTGDDALIISNDTDFYFAGNDFTIDCWIYYTAFNNPSQWNTIASQWSAGGAWILDFDSTNSRLQFAYNNSISITGNTITMNTGEWYHIAVVNNSGTLTFYQNGVSAGGGAVGTINTPTLPVRVGNSGDGNGTIGYIDEFRISNGVARWTSNFTPPTSAYTT